MILQKSMLIKLFFAYYWSCGSSGICLTMGKGYTTMTYSTEFVAPEDWMLEIMASCMRLCGLASHEWPNSCNLNLYMAAWLHYVAPFRQLLH